MIVQKHITINGKDFIRTTSDSGRFVVGGEPFGEYVEAIDTAEIGRTYTEGELMPPDESALADKAEAFDILMGVIS
jgi:hypothetical protein